MSADSRSHPLPPGGRRGQALALAGLLTTLVLLAALGAPGPPPPPAPSPVGVWVVSRKQFEAVNPHLRPRSGDWPFRPDPPATTPQTRYGPRTFRFDGETVYLRYDEKS